MDVLKFIDSDCTHILEHDAAVYVDWVERCNISNGPCFLRTTTEEARLVAIGFYLAWWNDAMVYKNQGAAFYCRGNHASTWLDFWQSKQASSVQLDAMVVCIFGGLGIIRLSRMHSPLTPILECAVKSAVWRSLSQEIQHSSLCESYYQG